MSPSLLWDTTNDYICGLVISYTARQKNNSRKEQRKLELDLHELQTEYNSSPFEERRNDIQTVKAALEALLTKKAEKSMFFARKGCTNW